MLKKILAVLSFASAVVAAVCSYIALKGIYNGYFNLVTGYFHCPDRHCKLHLMISDINTFTIVSAVIAAAIVLSFAYLGIILLKKKSNRRQLIEAVILIVVLLAAHIVCFKKIGPTRLMAAIFLNRPEAKIVKIAEKDRDINKIRFGYSALKYAVMSGANPKIIRAMAAGGADINQPLEIVGDRMKEMAENSKPGLQHQPIAEKMPFFMSYIAASASKKNPSEEDKKNDAEIVKLFIEKGMNVNAKSPKEMRGEPLIMQAMARYRIRANTNLEILKMLVKAGANVNACDHTGITPLMLSLKASSFGDYPFFDDYEDASYEDAFPEAALFLIQNGADINARDNNGTTVLQFSAGSDKNIEITKKIIEAGANVNAKDGDGKTILMTATPQSAEILVQNGADINAKEKSSGMTVLMYASKRGDDYIELTKRILKQGKKADVNAKAKDTVTMDGNSALHFAAGAPLYSRLPIKESKNLETVKLLTANGADVNSKNAAGATPLMYASPESAEILLKAGADINAKDNHGITVLMYAVMKGDKNIEFTKRILELKQGNKAYVNAKSRDGMSALHFAAGFKYNMQNLETVKLLIANGADVNAKNSFGDTPLLSYAYRSNADIIKVLIDAGADVNASSKKGETPLMRAAKFNDINVAKLLIDSGADIKAKDNDGKTAYDWLAENNKISGEDKETVKKLLEVKP
ncbi:MAG: ankyrin repeat domain-containing protein [Endomicrobia bacterium]|nr:ankyrin repeat domain-containing protein [Endomicrobiia bacterium]